MVWVIEVLVSEPEEAIWTPFAVRLTARGAARLYERLSEEEDSYRVRAYAPVGGK